MTEKNNPQIKLNKKKKREAKESCKLTKPTPSLYPRDLLCNPSAPDN